MGFAKAFGYGNITQLTKQISKPVGTLWFITALLFILAAMLFIFKRDWWLTGFIAIMLSQILILISWKDAKIGTIANALVLLVALPAFGDWNFNKKFHKETAVLLTRPASLSAVVMTREMLKDLPGPVQLWMERSGSIGKELIQNVHIKQSGEMKLEPGSKWFPFVAEQYNTVTPPAFIWKTKIEPSPFMFIAGKDKYEEGKGNMLIKPYALFTIADKKGPEADQGSLLRYLAEICWFPSAVLSEYIQWEPVDSLSAKATMTYGGISASGFFHFNADGDMMRFEAERYFTEGKKKPRLERWVVTTLPGACKAFQGIRIPYRSEVTWKLKEGDFTWLRLEIAEIKYNVHQ
jgi:hypothetical protein